MECIQHIRKSSKSESESMRDPSQPHNPLYSNVPTLPIMPSTRELANPNGLAHDSSVQEGSHMLESTSSSGDYQNVFASTKGRRSPYVQGVISTEHGSSSAEGRNNLSPPAALKKLRPSLIAGMHASTDSEEQSLEDSLTSRHTPSAQEDELDSPGNDFFHLHASDRRQVYQNTSILSKQEGDEEELCLPQM